MTHRDKRDMPGQAGTRRNVPAWSPVGTGGTNGTPPFRGGVPGLSRPVSQPEPGQTGHADAEKLVDLLGKSEAALIEAVARTDFLTIREAGKLVGMVYKLRSMRHEVELKAGIW